MSKVIVVLITLLLIDVTSAAQSSRELTHRVTLDKESGLAIASACNDGSLKAQHCLSSLILIEM